MLFGETVATTRQHAVETIVPLVVVIGVGFAVTDVSMVGLQRVVGRGDSVANALVFVPNAVRKAWPGHPVKHERVGWGWGGVRHASEGVTS